MNTNENADKNTNKKNSLYCYGIVLYCFVLMFFIFTIIKSLHSMFLVPVTESLGMERSAFSFLFTVSGVAVAFALPVVPKLLKRYPTKLVISVCILMTSCGFAAYSLARTSWHFYVIAAIVGIGTAGCTNMVGSLLINNWFADRRGLALGIAFTGSGFGTAILSPVLTELLATRGWQFSYVVMGLMIGLACLPLTWLFAYQNPSDRNAEPYRDTKKKSPEQAEEEPVKQAKPVTGPMLRELRGKWFFWVYFMAICLWSLTIGGVHMHIAAYLTDIGHSAGFVALVYSTQAVCIIAGKILLGMIFDAKGSKAGILFMAVSFSMAVICLTLAKEPILALLFAVCYSCGSIFTSVGLPYVTSSFFGQRDYAEILSLVTVAYTIGASVGPFISGLFFDAVGSYRPLWLIYLVIFILSIVIVWTLKHYLEQHYQKEWFETESL